MFITLNTTTSTSGKVYYSHRLVESVRVGSKVNRTVLLNLGSSFDLEQGKWKALVEIIENKLSGTPGLFPPPADLEKRADEIVSQLRERKENAHKRVDSVDLSTLRHEDCRGVGNERIVLKGLELLGVESLFKQLGVGKKQSPLRLAQIASRLIRPGSEAESERWLKYQSSLPELLGINPLRVSSKRLFRAADKLYHHKEKIEAHLSHQEGKLFGCEHTIIFYDLTNTWFYGRPKHDLAQFGRNKQKRNDCPQVSLGLCLNEAGFPVRSEILPGAVSEPATLKNALNRLGERGKEALVVMDAGIGSDENIAWLEAQEVMVGLWSIDVVNPYPKERRIMK